MSEQDGGFDLKDIEDTKVKFKEFEESDEPILMMFKNKVVFAVNEHFRDTFPHHQIIGYKSTDFLKNASNQDVKYFSKNTSNEDVKYF